MFAWLESKKSPCVLLWRFYGVCVSGSFLSGRFRFPEGAGVKQAGGGSAGSPVSGVKRASVPDFWQGMPVTFSGAEKWSEK